MGVRRGPAPSALLVYGVLSLITLGIAFARDASPIETEAWFSMLPLWSRHLLSVAGGVVLAGGTIRATRLFVGRWGWAKSLHSDLRPVVRDAGDGTILVLGFASGIAEELFFRGLLTPLLGLVLSSIAFGALVDRFNGRYDIPLMLFGVMLAISAAIYTQIDPTEQLIPENSATPAPSLVG